MKLRTRLLLSAIAPVMAFGGPTLVLGGGAAAQVLTDDVIVVTAQKREEDIQKIGLSVTAFSGDAIRDFGFADSTDIVAQVPGLNVGTPVGEGNNPSFTLRGVGLNDFNDNNEGPIAIYVDNVYQAALPGLTFQLFDTERVEVLRGPQGTLYGRNATGGLINFISRKPSEELEGYARIEGGSYGTVNFEGAIGGSLTEHVRARISAASNNHRGYVHNRIGPDANQADDISVRGQLEFDIGESGVLNLTGFYSRANTNAPQYQHQATLGPTGADNLPFCPTDVPRDIFCYADTDGDNFAGEYNRVGILDIESKGAHATYTQRFGGVTMTNIFSYQKTDKHHEEDTDMGPNPAMNPTFRANIEAYTNELRFAGEYSRGNWQIGGYFIDTTVKSADDLPIRWRGDFAALLDSDPAAFDGALAAFNPGFNTGPGLLDAIVFDVDYTQDTRSWAGFAQFDFALTDSLTLTGGIRYTTEDRNYDYINQAPPGALLNNVLAGLGEANYFSMRPGDVNGFGAAVGHGPADVVSADASVINGDNISGKAVLDWQVSSDLLLYASWSRGFKSGGFNAGFLDQTDFVTSDQVKFGQEVLTSYETGFKWTAPNNRVRVNASGFYYDYNDFQALTFQGLSQFIRNADATFYGAEAEIGLRPFEGLDAQFGVSLLNTDVDGIEFQGAPLNNREAVLAPEVTANGFVRYGRTVGGGELAGMFSFNYQGDHFFDITNSAVSHEKGYALFDARISYASTDGPWEVAVFGRNLTDKEYRVYTFDFTGPAGLNQQFFGPPRWWGVSLEMKF